MSLLVARGVMSSDPWEPREVRGAAEPPQPARKTA